MITETSTALQIFDFHNCPIRVTDRNGNLWFVAKDVCDALGLKNSRKALTSLKDYEKATVTNSYGNPSAGIPNTYSIISESGLYCLVLRSRKPAAEEFTRWVTCDVLPSLRKTGSYSMNDSHALIEELKKLSIENARLIEENLDMRERVKKFETADGMFRLHEISMMLHQRHGIGKGTESDLAARMIERKMLQKDQSAKRGKIFRPYKKHQVAGYFTTGINGDEWSYLCYVTMTPKGFCWLENTLLGLTKAKYYEQRPLLPTLNQNRLQFDSPHEIPAPKIATENPNYTPNKPR